MRDRNSQFFKFARNQRARSDQGDARPELQQSKDVRTRDATEQNIADDRRHEARNRPFSSRMV